MSLGSLWHNTRNDPLGTWEICYMMPYISYRIRICSVLFIILGRWVMGRTIQLNRRLRFMGPNHKTVGPRLAGGLLVIRPGLTVHYFLERQLLQTRCSLIQNLIMGIKYLKLSLSNCRTANKAAYFNQILHTV